MASTMIVLDPMAPIGAKPQRLRRALDGLAGKAIGFIDNAKPNFHHLVDDLADLFCTKHGVASVIKRRKRGASVPVPDSVLAELTEQCTLVITGSGD